MLNQIKSVFSYSLSLSLALSPNAKGDFVLSERRNSVRIRLSFSY